MKKEHAIEIIDSFTHLYEKFYMEHLLKEDLTLYRSHIMTQYEQNISDLKIVKQQLLNNMIDNL